MKYVKEWGVVNTQDRGICLQFVVPDCDVILLEINKDVLKDLLVNIAVALEWTVTKAENEMPKMPWERR